MTFWLYMPSPDRLAREPVEGCIRDLTDPFVAGDTLFVLDEAGVSAVHSVRCALGDRSWIDTEDLEAPIPRMLVVSLPGVSEELAMLEAKGKGDLVARHIPLDAGRTLLKACLGAVTIPDLWAPCDVEAPIPETETQRVRSERLTQGAFRDRLITFWGGRCCVTGLASHHFLRASHIKPWAVATNRERMDPHNGLLLAVSWDFAFDRGFVTFDDEGTAEVHPEAESEGLASMGVHAGARIRKALTNRQRAYLEHHRVEVFGSWMKKVQG